MGVVRPFFPNLARIFFILRCSLKTIRDYRSALWAAATAAKAGKSLLVAHGMAGEVDGARELLGSDAEYPRVRQGPAANAGA